MEKARVLNSVNRHAVSSLAQGMVDAQQVGRSGPSLIQRALAEKFLLEGLDLRLELDAVGWHLNVYRAENRQFVTDFGLISAHADRGAAGFDLTAQLLDLIRHLDRAGSSQTSSH